MDLKKLAKVADASFGAGKSGSFSDFREAIGNNPSSEEAYLFVKEILKKDIISKAKKKVSWASGADRPGERVAWGPASNYREVLERVMDVEEFIADYSWDVSEKLADVLGVDEDDLEDLKITQKIKDKVYEAFLKPDDAKLRNGEFALVVFDWNDLGEFVVNGTVSEEELIDFLLGGEGHSYRYSECPWGLYQCMLLCGLDPKKFTYVNTNEEFPGTPTTESVSEELEDKVSDLVDSDNEGHLFSWKQGWNPFK